MIFLAHCILVVSLCFFGFCIVLFSVRQQYMSPRKTSLRLWLVSPNADVLVSSVGSVHAGSTFPAIQGASLTSLSSQPNSLVTGGFPAEDEQHSQPVSPQGLHYLHSAYQVGKDSQVGFFAPLEKNSGQGYSFFTVWQLVTAVVGEDGILATWGKPIHGQMWRLKCLELWG